MRARVIVQSQAGHNKWVNGLEEKVPTDLMVSVKQDTQTNPGTARTGGSGKMEAK